MTKNSLHKLIREEIQSQLSEISQNYVDKYKVVGVLVTDTTKRPQQEIFSDIRSLTGVTIVSSKDIDQNEYSQNNENLKVVLTLKIDGYPFIKHGGFGREKVNDIIASVKRVDNVKAFKVNPKNITIM